MIKVLLFDLGNVILPFSHFQIAEKLLPYSGHQDFQDPSRIFAYLFDLQSGAVNGFDTGEVAPLQFFESVRKDLLLSLSFEEFLPIWTDIFTENRDVSEVVLSLKGKCRLGLLSNTDPLHFPYVVSKYPVLSVFDQWILSYEVGAKKPDARIYRKAIEWASVRPQEILFIDDVEKNVDAAISLGMEGIHFRSASQMREELSVRMGWNQAKRF